MSAVPPPDLQARKPARRDEARRAALAVADGTGRVRASLVAVGPWILDDTALVADLAAWRARAMRMFLAQFTSTPELTARYLRRYSLADEHRILFVIEEPDGSVVGHVGLSGVEGGEAEIDNLMLGRRVAWPDLAVEAERTLVAWALDHLGVRRLHLRVLSYNLPAIDLHERVGFRTVERLPLRRMPADPGTLLVPCAPEEAEVRFTCLVMELRRS